MLRFDLHRSCAFVALLSFACAAEEEALTDEAVLSDTDDGKADGVTELRVRAGETTLWIDKSLARKTRDGVDELVLSGRTSRNIVAGNGFVFDDPYGDFRARGPRSFDLAWAPTEAASLLMGVNQFVSFTFTPSSGRPGSMTARVVARPRLVEITGSGAYLSADLVPVVSGGRTVYRVKGTASSDLATVTAEAGGVALSDVRIVDPRHFQVDLLLDHVLALAGHEGELVIRIDLASGSNRTRRARLAVVVKKLGFTAGDATEVWPPPVCEDEVRDCLTALPAGTTDLGVCGEAIPVLQCAGSTGPSVTDVEITGRLAALDGVLAGAAFLADAEALVGANRAAQLSDGIHADAEEALQALYGQVYPDAAARDAALDAAVEGALDRGYARPLEHVEALEPIPGDLARARELAADALLAHLATVDLVETEYARTLETLTRQFRALHVAHIRYFRAEAEDEAAPATPTFLFTGRWLDVYIELQVDRATGVAAPVFFEID